MKKDTVSIIIKALIILLMLSNFFIKDDYFTALILHSIILLLVFEKNIVNVFGKKTEEDYENELINNLNKIEKSKEDFNNNIVD